MEDPTDMPKVRIITDELCTDHAIERDPKPAIHGEYGVIVNVPTKTLARWKAHQKAHNAWLDEVAKILEGAANAPV